MKKIFLLVHKFKKKMYACFNVKNRSGISRIFEHLRR